MKLQEVIVLTATYYSKDLTEPLLRMYLEDLADLDPEKCIAAYNSYRRDPKNRTMPLPAHIREIVRPDEFVSPEIEARETARRIVGAVTKFGWNNAREAEAFIGPIGWDAVNRSGGWSIICEQMNSFNKSTFEAQMRDLLEGQFKHGLTAIETKLKIAPRNLPGALVQGNFARLLGEKIEGDET
jgi:hypothetical protein